MKLKLKALWITICITISVGIIILAGITYPITTCVSLLFSFVFMCVYSLLKQIDNL